MRRGLGVLVPAMLALASPVSAADLRPGLAFEPASVDPHCGGAFDRGLYSNAEFDSALDQALVALDRQAREALLIKATDIAFRDFARLPLHHRFNIEAMARSSRHPPRIDGRIRAAEITPQKGE
jgi:ABC-type transport system substrate-binding protein